MLNPRETNNVTREVEIRSGTARLEGTLAIPSDAHGIVIFAHGSGSSRFSSRNRYVASELQRGHLATLLFDLLTRDEEATDDVTSHLRFDIPFLAHRLVDAVEWAGKQTETRDLPIGLFGASTGGGAALFAAAERPQQITAVVSRGGRPDLAGEALLKVRASTLLIVGSRDEPVIEINQSAMDQLTCEKRLAIVPGASHLFEEPGTLEDVARLATAWFSEHLHPARV
ncbi:MAG TPA: dienelactone hydrolase family protein [Tepidisphaeraceae bacterium]|jgi:dienelactone hydrolase|nr:dienelactone hydrolase family protein [Tepidisphaeraceae bacterium]